MIHNTRIYYLGDGILCYRLGSNAFLNNNRAAINFIENSTNTGDTLISGNTFNNNGSAVIISNSNKSVRIVNNIGSSKDQIIEEQSNAII